MRGQNATTLLVDECLTRRAPRGQGAVELGHDLVLCHVKTIG
jgi:hypothetical protein